MPHLSSKRLRLLPMEPPLMGALLKGDMEHASLLGGFRIPPGLELKARALEMRIEQLRTDPSLLPWLLHAVVLNESNCLCGRIGFHSSPGPAELRHLSPKGVELGYEIDPRYRRRGLAKEAAVLLMRWAFDHHGEISFVLSVSPTNHPSLAMARSLGFEQVGWQEDDEDGLELIFLREIKAWPEEWNLAVRQPGVN